MKNRLLLLTAWLLHIYFRWVPISAGKHAVWHRIVRPYILWRPFKLLRTTTVFGMKMNVQFPDTIQTCIYFFGFWEPTITKYIQMTLQEGDTFIDIGANVGYDTLLASRCVGSTGKVYCFEASPSIYSLLKTNLKLNNVTNVTSYNIAVTDRPCEVPIYLHSADNLGGSSIIPQVAAERSAEIEGSVQGLPLPGILDAAVICQARMIKIDVEGAEWNVVRGIGRIIAELSQKTEVLIEINEKSLAANGATLKDMLDIFMSAGYEPYMIDNEYSAYFNIKKPEPVLHKVERASNYEQADFIFRKRGKRD